MPDDIRDQGHEKILKDKLEIPTLLLKKQHELNLEILEKQHQLNLEIHHKQSKLLIWSIIATIVAALLGALVGSYLTTRHSTCNQVSTQEQHNITKEKIIQ